MQFKNLLSGFLSALSLSYLALGGASVVAAEVQSVFTLHAPEGRWMVRALTSAQQCPFIAWDQKNPVPMQVRASQAVVPVRADVVQADSKPSVFDVLSCESLWPEGAKSASVDGQAVPPPAKSIQRILIIADTGCRLKASENAFQDCNDADKWPFAKVAKQKSIDPSKEQSGQAGWVLPAQVNPSIALVMTNLPKGGMSNTPIQTPNGWYIIKVEEKRPFKVPSFDESKNQIRANLIQQKQAEVINALREKAKITQ